jgi:multiple sugar transport system permease protein
VSGAEARQRRLGREGRDALIGVAFILPAVILFLAIIVVPLVQGVLMSLFSIETLTKKATFVGLDNYREILGGAKFWVALRNTVVWATSAAVLQLVLGVGAALILHGRLVGRAAARSIVLFPYLLPMVVAVLVWQWLFNDLHGIANYLLLQSGLIGRPLNWLGEMPNAMISVILVGTWKFFPFVVISVLARLQSIPEALYEAARIDGANAWERFWDITLPQLRGVLTIVVLLRFIWDFKEFDLIWLLTGGGPVNSTQTLPLLVYELAFPLLSMGKASAVAVAMLVVMVLLFWIYLRLDRADEEVD